MIDTKLIDAAWDELRKSVIEYRGQPVGTVAARDPNSDALNYDQCFTRDFAVVETDDGTQLAADFGEHAIARVAPVDSGLWWLIVLRAYVRASYHLRCYYWLDFERLNDIYRYKVEEYGSQIVNTFNIQPGTILPALVDWMPARGGYFAGNVGPGRMDFRYFAQGNLLAVVSSLATQDQAQGIMDLIEQRWDDLVGQMPLKLCFPALKGRDWEIVTGADTKNIPWSYHNGGNWPFLLWLLAAVAQKTGRPALATRALETAAGRLEAERWAEYFDGHHGRLVGKEARRFQTWTVAGFLVAHQLLAQPAHLDLLSFQSRPTAEACAWRAVQTEGADPD